MWTWWWKNHYKIRSDLSNIPFKAMSAFNVSSQANSPHTQYIWSMCRGMEADVPGEASEARKRNGKEQLGLIPLFLLYQHDPALGQWKPSLSFNKTYDKISMLSIRALKSDSIHWFKKSLTELINIDLQVFILQMGLFKKGFLISYFLRFMIL